MQEVTLRVCDGGKSRKWYKAEKVEEENVKLAGIPSPGDTVDHGGARYVATVNYGKGGGVIVTLVNSVDMVVGVNHD